MRTNILTLTNGKNYWKNNNKKMETLSKILTILTSIMGFIIVIIFCEILRSFFGEDAGNMFISVLVGVAIATYFGFKLWNKGQRKQVIVLAWIIGALFFGFLGFFIHPDKIYLHTADRMYYPEKFMGLDYSPLSEKTSNLINIELAARQIEHEAALFRLGKVEYYNWQAQKSIGLWIFSGLLVINGIISFLKKE